LDASLFHFPHAGVSIASSGKRDGAKLFAVLSKGRHEEARVILQRLHDDHEDPLFWEKEYIQIAAQCAREIEEKARSSWAHMLTNKRELRRVVTAIIALTSVQTNGAQTIQAYQVNLSLSMLSQLLTLDKVNSIRRSRIFPTKHSLNGRCFSDLPRHWRHCQSRID
jgi:hypothetical protein